MILQHRLLQLLDHAGCGVRRLYLAGLGEHDSRSCAMTDQSSYTPANVSEYANVCVGACVQRVVANG